jgi:hypothetical protein
MENAAIDIILPVIEASLIYASHYCKSTGRSTVTAKDMEYGMKYAAMSTVGKHIGSHFPEIYEEESESDEECVEIVDDSDEPFTRYVGTEELFVKMNEAYDTWDSWEPESPAEIMIKNAIESQSNGRIF